MLITRPVVSVEDALKAAQAKKGDCDRGKLRLFIGHQLVEKPSQQFSWSPTTQQSSAGPQSSRPNSGRA